MTIFIILNFQRRRKGGDESSLLKGTSLIILYIQGRRSTVEGAGAELDLASLKEEEERRQRQEKEQAILQKEALRYIVLNHKSNIFNRYKKIFFCEEFFVFIYRNNRLTLVSLFVKKKI